MIKTLLFLTLSLLIISECFSQGKILHGNVVDVHGRPIALASITFKGFSYGTMTDKDGNYTALISEKYDSIICTHINYSRAIEKIDGNSTINFKMETIKPSPTTILIDTTLSQSGVSVSKNANEKVKGDKYFEKVEIFASFFGGEKALKHYLNTNLIASMPDTFAKVKGSVKYGFTISSDGTPKDFFLLKGVDKSIDEYVMQILAAMPKWKPAIQNGRSVEQYREVEIYLNIR
ncbi:energy transducer TonB [Terrimonas rubra]|uniref:Energy transducer TonB n=1 Tax=Terrimonas rubra TaxID=1035890 RepID=A0ABW6A0A5_9BACT